jgi:mannose-6-phosphate isomerase-like protein (cupin superfamily)
MKYDFYSDEKYGPLKKIDLDAEAAAHAPWVNQTLTHVDDAVVRLGVLDGEFHWHKHDEEDELFLVLSGRLSIEVEGHGEVILDPHQAYAVPKGVRHKPRAHGRTVVVMIERASVVPTGD